MSGNVTQNTYNALGLLIETKNLTEGTVTRTVYDENGRAEYTVDRHVPGQPANGTRTIYDALGRVVETQRRSGIVIDIVDDPNYPGLGIKAAQLTDAGTVFSETATEYDAAGRVIASTGADGQTTQFEHDDAGRQTAVIDALNNRTEYDYDGAGQQIMVIDALDRETHFRHDALGRVVETIRHDHTTTETVYDVLGNRVAAIDPLGLQTDYEYDLLGNLTAVELPEVTNPDTGQPERPRYEYEYDDFGNQTVQRDALGRETTYTHDAFGNRLTRTLPDIPGEPTATETTEYDDFGRRDLHVDFAGNQTVWVYDALSRVDEERWFAPGESTGGTPDILIDYTYDALGRADEITHTEGAIVRVTDYDYDLDGRTTRVASEEGVIEYDYDEATGRLTRTWTDHTDVSYDYDELGRLATVTATKLDGDPANEVITYAYDAVGNLETLTLPNGVVATHTYDDLHRLTSLVYEKDAQAIATFTYTLDEAGQRVQLDETIDGLSRTIQYDYDNLYRLVEEKVTNAHADLGGDYTQSWTHDLVGNRIEQVHSVNGITTYTYDERDQLTENEIDSTITTYEYDANGSMVKKTTGGQSDTYEYDIRNRMVEANVDGVALEYTYDHDGERVSKTADDGGGPVTEHYLLDKNNLTGYSQVLQQSATQGGAPDRTFVIGHRVLIQADGSTLRHLLHDGHGSVRAILDATGQVATDQIYAYDAYGVRISPNATILTPLLYAGEWFDAELGRSYNRARWYDPSLGRFDAFDPFEGNRVNPLTLHKHLYGHANPVMNLDPTGNMSLASLATNTFARTKLLTTHVLRSPIMQSPLIRAALLVGGTVAPFVLIRQTFFVGDRLTEGEQAKVATAIQLLRDHGYTSQADRAAQITFRSRDLLDDIEAWGMTPFAFRTVYLDPESFALDDRLFAALVIHEVTHTQQWFWPARSFHWWERHASQVESDFLRDVGLTGTTTEVGNTVGAGWPNTAYLISIAETFFDRNVENPAVVPAH